MIKTLKTLLYILGIGFVIVAYPPIIMIVCACAFAYMFLDGTNML